MNKPSFLTFLMLTTVLSMGFMPVDARAEERHATITGFSGDAYIMQADGEHAAGMGMVCKKGDEIQVREDGFLDLEINRMVGCRFLAKTNAKLVETDSGNMRVTIEKGDILLNINKLSEGESFELQTPIALAAVRGTQFWGRVTPPEDSSKDYLLTLAVREGMIEVTPKGSETSVMLKEGEALDFRASSEPQIRQATSEELTAIAQSESISMG